MTEERLLVIFAHPDDEVFRCGGTLALLSQQGVQVHVLTFTRGQAGSCGDPPLCPPAELGKLRTAELRCSCQALGLEAPLVLDYQDGKLAEVADEEALGIISARIQDLHPQALLTWPFHGLSGHPDHIAVSRWVTAAFERATQAGDRQLSALYHLAVPASIAQALGMRQLHTLPDTDVTLTVDVEPLWERKLAAIACHRTQAGESPILQAPLERQKLFLGQEHFQRVSGSQANDVLWNHVGRGKGSKKRNS